jgi:HupE / UreJ protein
LRALYHLRYRVTLFQDVDPAARHLAIIVTDNGERELAFDRGVPEITLSGDGSSMLEVVGRFVEAGIDHIFLGYDHIAFLLAVILWGQSLGSLVKVVTAFTVAHSLTLSLAAPRHRAGTLVSGRTPDRRHDRLCGGRELFRS